MIRSLQRIIAENASLRLIFLALDNFGFLELDFADRQAALSLTRRRKVSLLADNRIGIKGLSSLGCASVIQIVIVVVEKCHVAGQFVDLRFDLVEFKIIAFQ